MSQLCTIKPSEKITDIAALRSAVTDLGLNLQENMDVRFYSGTERCNYGIKLEGRYDLGFIRQSDGSYQFRADNELVNAGKDSTGRGAQGRKTLGENCGKLFQRYRYRLLEKGLRGTGMHIVSTKTGLKGQLLLDVQRIAVGGG